MIGLVVFNAILNQALSAQLASHVSRAALTEGLPETSLPALIEALTSSDASAFGAVPGANEEIITAAVTALRQVYNIGFRRGYATAAGFSAAAALSESIWFRYGLFPVHSFSFESMLTGNFFSCALYQKPKA